MPYLDVAASTKPKQEVVDAMMPYLSGDKWYNPSSLYSNAAKVKEDIENARKIAADFINAEPNEIYFTSGGSESNCWAIQGFINNVRQYYGYPVIITSKIEHKSIMECVESMKCTGVAVEKICVNKDGLLYIDDLERVLSTCSMSPENKILVSIQIANNEIGVIQPIREIADIAHEYGAVFHTDAVQAFGQMDIDVKKLDIDMMSVSGHKIGAPKGVGFLYKKNDVDICPLIYGSQMDAMRGGTENTAYIMGMAKAIELVSENKNVNYNVCALRNHFIWELEKIGCRLIGNRECRLPNNISIMLPEGCGGEEMLYILDMAGIQCSTGSACNSHSVEPSYVLKAIGLTDEEARRVIRLTISHDITIGDIDKVVDEIGKAISLLTMKD